MRWNPRCRSILRCCRCRRRGKRRIEIVEMLFLDDAEERARLFERRVGVFRHDEAEVARGERDRVVVAVSGGYEVTEIKVHLAVLDSVFQPLVDEEGAGAVRIQREREDDGVIAVARAICAADAIIDEAGKDRAVRSRSRPASCRTESRRPAIAGQRSSARSRRRCWGRRCRNRGVRRGRTEPGHRGRRHRHRHCRGPQ